MERSLSTTKRSTQADLIAKGKNVKPAATKKAGKKVARTGMVDPPLNEQPKIKKSIAAKPASGKKKPTIARTMTLKEDRIPVVKNKQASETPRKSRARQPKSKLDVSERKVEESRSSAILPLQRRNGLSERSVMARSLPTSPNLSPDPLKQHLKSPQSRRQAFFVKDTNDAKDSKGRRDVVSNTTDDFAKERMAVRVLWKKF